MIKSFDKTNLKQLRADLDAAFRDVAKKHGIQIALKNISYQPERASSKIEFIALGNTSTSGAAPTGRDVILQADFKRYCSSFGLKPEQYGATITFGRDQYKLTGLKPRAPKRPIIATNMRDGKSYILPESAIASLQSKDHRELFGIPTVSATVGSEELCSNETAFDASFKPIGKCPRKATTNRKVGLGNARSKPFCAECARLMDESRMEMEAEARANR